MQTLTSQITNVTVFPDRALVTRTARLTAVQVGEHHLVFDQLPSLIDSKSIQVNGHGKAILANVKLKKSFEQEITDEEVRLLEIEHREVADKLMELELVIERLEKERFFLDEISKRVTSPEGTTELNPEKWILMINFYRQRLAEIDRETMENKLVIRGLNEKKQVLIKKMANFKQQRLKEKQHVEVIVEMIETGDLTLELSYIVSQASWHPVYDLRVSTEKKIMNITYNAIVKQQTGENWDEVGIKISTAKPQISGQHEELTPWKIHLKPKPQYGYGYSSGGAKTEIDAITMQREEIMQNVSSTINEEFSKLNKPAVEKAASTSETTGNAVFFNVVGKHSVKADGNDHKVTILVQDFPAHFRYSVIPKNSPYAYLKAKVYNDSEYPLLAGETNVFLDNNFVANASIKTVVPTEEFWAFLGIDESMKVEYKRLKRYEKEERSILLKKFKIIQYEYQINIKNLKKTQEEIVIWEQLPISQNDNIKVHLIEPVYKEDTETLIKNEFEALKWFYKPKPNEEIIIPFKYAVEFPYEDEVIGLE